jgi:DNA-binding NtrC family response regulator
MSKKPTVLLVDDDPGVLAAMRHVLADAYNVVTTTVPTQVLGLVEKEKPDVLVSDVEMPLLQGTQLIALVRLAYPDVVRILLTGDTSLASALNAINEGEVYRYLLKPLKIQELRETVALAVARREELRALTEVGLAAARRERLLAQLEREHPGITDVPPADRPHAVDPAAARATLAWLGERGWTGVS